MFSNIQNISLPLVATLEKQKRKENKTLNFKSIDFVVFVKVGLKFS